MAELAHRNRDDPSAEDAAPRADPADAPPVSAPSSRSRPRGAEWPGRITGLYVGSRTLEAVGGRSHRGVFRVNRWARGEVGEGEDTSVKLRELFQTGRIPRERICTFVPSALLTTRYFRLPTIDPAEVRAMVPHQLSISLPVDVDQVAWNTSLVDEHEDGSATVLVQIIRKDQLDAHLSLVRDVSPNVWAAIPEGQMLARFVARVLDRSELTSSGERSVLTWTCDAYHLLVEREGDLLYQRSFPANPEHWQSESAQVVSEMLLLTIGEIQGARGEIAKLTEGTLPEPLHVLPRPGRGLEPVTREFSARLSEQLGIRTVAVASSEEDSVNEVPLACSLAELGAFSETSLLPPEEVQSLNRREGKKTLVRFGVMAAAFLLLGMLSLFVSLRRQEARLDLLRARVVESQAQVDEVERMREALSASEAASGSDMELFRVMASVERALPSAVYLQKLSYSRGGRVQIEGSSPELGVVNDLAKRLEEDSLWERVHILRLQRPGRDPEAAYQFAMEGKLAGGGGAP